jgi:hypothetical protein
MSENSNWKERQKAKTEILKRVEETLQAAIIGLEDLIKGPPERKVAGLRNLIVFGRAVTNVLQNLRSAESTFDEWYEKYKVEMKSDPLMRYFYKLRTEILKEGKLEFFPQVYIKQLRMPQDLRHFGPPPPNAKGFFIGDQLGGSGWEIQFPDGSIEKLYVQLPYDIGVISLHFPNPPEFHIGHRIEDNSIEALSRMYMNYIGRLVSLAKEKFN